MKIWTTSICVCLLAYASATGVKPRQEDCKKGEPCVQPIRRNRAVFEAVGEVKGISRPTTILLERYLAPPIAAISYQCKAAKHMYTDNSAVFNFGTWDRWQTCETYKKQFIGLLQFTMDFNIEERAIQIIEKKPFTCNNPRSKRGLAALFRFAKSGLTLAAKGARTAAALKVTKTFVKKVTPAVMVGATAWEVTSLIQYSKQTLAEPRTGSTLWDLNKIVDVTRRGQKFMRSNAPLVSLLQALPLKRLAPAGIDRAKLNTELVNLRREAEERNIELEPTDVLDLFDYEVGHMFDPCSLKATIAVNVPGHVKGTAGMAYRYIPTPLDINGVHLVPAPETPIVIVDKMGTIIDALTEEEFRACRDDGQFYICARGHRSKEAATSTCVGGLFRGEASALSAFCRFRDGTQDTTTTSQIEANLFLVNTQKPVDIIVNCPTKSLAETTKSSTVEVTVPANCTVTINGKTYHSTPLDISSAANARVVIIGLMREALTKLAKMFDNDVIKTSIAFMTKGLDSYEVNHLLGESEHDAWHFNNIISMLVCSFIVSAAWCLCGGACYQFRDKLPGCKRKTNGDTGGKPDLQEPKQQEDVVAVKPAQPADQADLCRTFVLGNKSYSIPEALMDKIAEAAYYAQQKSAKKTDTAAAAV